jgi:uncharacterized membrane protein HdeD (DUF308 family)
MKTLLKNLGIVILFIGVALLAWEFYSQTSNNTWLLTGLLLVILGFFAHIVLNKKFE